MKKSFFIIILFFIFNFFPKVQAQNLNIERYYLNIDVKEDNSIDVIESFRINYKNRQYRNDNDLMVLDTIFPQQIFKLIKGKKMLQEYSVDNIKLNYKKPTIVYLKDRINILLEPNIYKEKTIKDYLVTYTLKTSQDRYREFDRFYFKIADEKNKNTIKNLAFKIEMPKNFDSTKLKIQIVQNNSLIESRDEIYYTVEGRVIKGQIYSYPLADYEGITLRLDLPKGYFKTNLPYISSQFRTVIYSLALMLILILVYYFLKEGELKKIKCSFRQIEEVNFIQCAMIYSKSLKTNYITALIYYFALKGYIKIELLQNNFILKKIKDFSSDDYFLQTFFKMMFSEKDTISRVQMRKSEKFFVKLNLLKESLEKEKFLFFKKYTVDGIMKFFIFAVAFLFSAIFIYIIDNFSFDLFYYLDGSIKKYKILLIFLWVVLVVYKEQRLYSKKLYVTFCTINFFYLKIWFLFTILLLLDIQFINCYNILLSLIPLIGIILTFIFYFNIPQRNKFAQIVYRKTINLINFIKKSSKDELNDIINKTDFIQQTFPLLHVLNLDEILISKIGNIEQNWLNKELNLKTLKKLNKEISKIVIID